MKKIAITILAISFLGICNAQSTKNGPASGVKRQAVNFRNLSLTDFKIKIAHSGSAKSVLKVIGHLAPFN